MDFLRRPINAGDDAPGADPRGQKEFGGLARGRTTPGKLMAEHRGVISDLEIDPAGLVNQALVSTQTFVRGTERRTGRHRVEMDVERTQLRVLPEMQAQVDVTRILDRP